MSEKTPNMSQVIRDYAASHPVFGAGEIRTLHGEKAALLVTRLAAKGQFVRIRNGVFGTAEVEEDHPAYQAYLSRMHDALIERAASPEATLADRLFAWASERDTFSIGEASRHFGQDMKGHVAPYVKRGKIERIAEGAYRYMGEVPAARRTSSPMAEPDGDDHRTVMAQLSEGVATAADIAARSGIDRHRLRAVLARLVHDGRIDALAPSSTNAHRVYRIPTSSPTALDDETLSILAIVATAGPMSTRTARTHHVEDTPRHMHRLLAADLIEEAGQDIELGGTTYRATPAGLTALGRAGYQVASTSAVMHRPLERALLADLKANGPAGYAMLKKRLGRTESANQIEMAIVRLIKADAVTTDGRKPAVITIAAIGAGCFI